MIKNTSNKSHLFMVTTAAVVGVLSMHLGMALAMVNMQMPEPKTEKPKQSKPIEVELVKIEEKKPEPEPEVVEMKLSDKTSKVTQSRPQPKTDTEPKKTAPVNNKPPIKEQPVKKQPIKEQPVKKQDEERTKPTNQDNSHKNDNPNPRKDNQNDNPKPREDNQGDNSEPNEDIVTTPKGVDPLTTQQTQKVIGSGSAGSFKQQSGNSNANNNEPTKIQSAGDNENSGSGGNKEGPPQQPSDSGPQSFTINEAKWKVRPQFTPPRISRKPRGGKLTVVLKLTVDTQGKVSSRVHKTSGNSRVDRTAVKQVNRSKLQPFTKNGQPVVGIIYLPVEYQF